MIGLLRPDQATRWAGYRELVTTTVAPRAGEIDEQQVFPRELVAELGRAGVLGATLPAGVGGGGVDAVSYGLLSEELGRTCQSTRNFVAVQDMVASVLFRLGTPAQRERWLARIVGGEAVAAFALTEPEVGSDAAGIIMRATERDGMVRLDGVKRWISFGQIADVVLVFARYEGRHTAFLVATDTPGLVVEPLTGLLGLRGSMLAELRFDGCLVPPGAMLGRPGAGLMFVASAALDLGRFSTAWGAVGLAQACLDATGDRVAERVQFGSPIGEHQLIARIRADMVTDVVATRLLCHYAAVGRERDDPETESLTLMAKYRASTLATRSAADAVQLYGAEGVGASAPVQRHYRDAKVLEIIEGTTQIQQVLIGQASSDLGRAMVPSLQTAARTDAKVV